MAKLLEPNVRAYMRGEVVKRYMRIDDAKSHFGLDEESLLQLALVSGARYQLPKITLIHRQRMEDYIMKHIYKVPGSNKLVQKKFVRIGEGSITYSIGHHRFIEMARAAGAVYKIGEAKGNTILINLELLDEYMEQFHEPAREMKHPLFVPDKKEA